MNPHANTSTRSLVLPVCQFQHFREQDIYYILFFILSTTFLTFYIIFYFIIFIKNCSLFDYMIYTIVISYIKNKETSSTLVSLFLICGRWDLNPHANTSTRSLVLPVCQFQHFREQDIYYILFFILSTTFLTFYIIFIDIYYSIYGLYLHPTQSLIPERHLLFLYLLHCLKIQALWSPGFLPFNSFIAVSRPLTGTQNL